jgi:four helix bundle protein
VTQGQSRGEIRGFKDLEVWQVAMLLVQTCYELSRAFPDSEKFGLKNQLRRSAVSVPSNIAEGHGRGSPKSFLQFLWIANGSLAELETQVLLAVDLCFVDGETATKCLELIGQTGRMLTGLRRSVEKTVDRP